MTVIYLGRHLYSDRFSVFLDLCMLNRPYEGEGRDPAGCYPTWKEGAHVFQNRKWATRGDTQWAGQPGMWSERVNTLANVLTCSSDVI